MSIEVIAFVIPKDEYTKGAPNLLTPIHKKGDVVVSHGVDWDTGENVCLPTDNYHNFTMEHCEKVCGTWFLKD